MNIDKMRADFDAEIAEAERETEKPLSVEEVTLAEIDIAKVLNDRLIAKFKVLQMKQEHALVFGSRSPYCWLL